MIPLTTVLKNVPYSVEISQTDLEFGEMIKVSRARTDKIFAVDKNLIEIKLGKVSKKTFELIKLNRLGMF